MLTRYVDNSRPSDNLLNSLFDDMFHNVSRLVADVPGTRQGYRTIEDKGGMVLEVDLPGVAPSDVEVLTEDRHVVVRSTQGDQKSTARYVIHDRYDVSSATARMANGQLRVSFRPVSTRESRRVKIDVS